VIGGMAVIAHGYPRYTGDMDIWIRQNPENADKIVAVMLEFGFDAYDFRVEDFLPDAEGKAGFVSIGVEPLKIEILGNVLGVAFEECYARKTVIAVENIDTNFISLPDLIRSKQAAGRAKDKIDLENLPPITD
jgi:hypothetical protein